MELASSHRAYDDVRQDQLREGRSMSRDETHRPRFVKKKPELKGHEAFLKALEESGKTQGTRVQVEKKDGTMVVGTVKCSDKYTITIRVTQGETGEFRDRVIFKHDISEFCALEGKKREGGNG